jgi:mxaK protein
MGSRIKQKNIGLVLLLAIGIAGSAYEAYQLQKIDAINHALQQGQLITSDAYPMQKKFAAAYQLGLHEDFKHAVQTYSQLLETSLSQSDQAKIQFNIGNNLFKSGLNRRVNDDGTLKDEARYDFSQAKVAYQQALRLNPDSRLAKFNLSLLLSLLPENMVNAKKEQSGMELSNIPVGLP